jgi:hypothetical protein
MQYCSVKKIVKPETSVLMLHVTSLHALTKAVFDSYGFVLTTQCGIIRLTTTLPFSTTVQYLF